MSNFQFLKNEFKPLYEHATAVEALVNNDARAACIRARHVMEMAVHWLYERDRALLRPYDRSLNALLTQPDFRDLMGDAVWEKARLIQKVGNDSVHGSKPLKPYQAVQVCSELFHILYWVARNYSRMSVEDQRFDTKLLPTLVTTQQAVNFTKAELKKQEAKHQAEVTKLQAAAEAQDAKVEALVAARLAEQGRQAASLAEEREKALEQVNAELAAARAKLAETKSRNQQKKDPHDYAEADTRKLLIDVLLREAGWTVGEDAAEEVEVSGMPNNKGVGYVDYVLWGKDGKPLAVVEAKRTLKDPNTGKQQAKLYADCLEQMKGQRPVIFYTNGYETWLWDDQAAAPRAVQGFYNQDELDRVIKRRNSVTDPTTLSTNDEIAGRYYQKRAIKSLGEAFNNGQRTGLLTMATGTGKTRTAIALVDLLMRANLVKRVLFLADRVALVKQAANAFKDHLPDSSPVNLISEKNSSGRVFLSTYPTMMGLIEESDDGSRRYGVGHFDLVIIDEAHRSIYQKYGAIFQYFDALLVGLTATPKNEVHQDTYRVFGLETGVPTDAYSLDEGVADEFLVPAKAFDVPLKFVREGIQYEQLSDAEKEHWDELDWGDENEGHAPDEVSASAINKKLFNTDTVDKMLAHLMANGLAVDGGDTLGKTIIFAVNQKHALFISERFDANYPKRKGHFARVITHAESYAQTLIGDFSSPTSGLQIALSVDMLDTGIDVPEILNLVFFKAVRSKVKFLQMIGRGTRLCEDLFGPGNHKSEFFIFDYCGNFAYFNEHPDGAASTMPEPLGKRLFRTRAELLARLQQSNLGQVAELPASYGDDTPIDLPNDLVGQLHGEVSQMNANNFLVRPHGEHVSRFAKKESWHALDDEALAVIASHVAGLPSEQEPEHITAKLFDLACVNLQLALLEQAAEVVDLQMRIMAIAERLESKTNVPAVKLQIELIEAVQTEAWWKDVTLAMVENVRRKLRGLVKLIDKAEMKIVYTALEDEIGLSSEVELAGATQGTGVNWPQYRKKVERFIKEHKDHIAIARLRRALPLTAKDLDELERLVFESGEVHSREQFSKAYGEVSLPEFIRKLVGLDRQAALDAFAGFLDVNKYNSSQIRFVEMVINQLTANGVMDAGQLYEAPFTSVHYEGIEGVFPGSDGDVLVAVVQKLSTFDITAAL